MSEYTRDSHTSTRTHMYAYFVVTMKHERRAMKLRKLSWHIPPHSGSPIGAGKPVSFTPEEHKRIVDGSFYKGIRGKRSNYCNNISIVKMYPQNVKTVHSRNLNSRNVAQKYTRKRTKCICKLFIAVLFAVVKDWKQFPCPLMGH